jgi:transcriptional regulator with XRE-family HTH domain
MESIYGYVLDRLQAAKGGWPTVAEETGISIRTIEKIARQETKDPSVRLIEKLATYFRGQAKRSVSRIPA